MSVRWHIFARPPAWTCRSSLLPNAQHPQVAYAENRKDSRCYAPPATWMIAAGAVQTRPKVPHYFRAARHCCRWPTRAGGETPRHVREGISKTGEKQGAAPSPSATSRCGPLRFLGPEDRGIELCRHRLSMVLRSTVSAKSWMRG